MKRMAWLLLSAVVFAPDAEANKIKQFSIGNPQGFDRAPELEVYSTDGERWTTVDAADTSRFQVSLKAECQWEGSGKKAYHGDIRVPGFVLVGQKDPPNYDIPFAGSASGVFRWDGGEGQAFDPVKACNDELDKRVANDPKKTRYHFLAQGFSVNYPAAMRVNYTLTCKPTGAGFTDMDTKSVMVNTKVRCSGSPLAESRIPSDKPKPKRAEVKPPRQMPLLKAASFEADPEVHTGKCPTPIRFNGTMTANRAGTATYQYVKHDGTRSPVFKLEFDRAGTQPTRPWQVTVAQPDATKTLSAGGAAPGTVEGWYRLDVLSPAPTGQIQARYRVLCGADVEEQPAPATIRLIPPGG
jgi:hypothetical protein